MIAAEIPEIKQEAKRLRHGRRAKIQEAFALLTMLQTFVEALGSYL